MVHLAAERRAAGIDEAYYLYRAESEKDYGQARSAAQSRSGKPAR
jgi:hypothetical protein